MRISLAGRLLSTLLLISLIGASFGFHAARAAGGYVIPAAIKHRGYLLIGTNPPYYPMEDNVPNSSSCCIGADVDLGNAIAKQMGLGTKWIGVADFGALIGGVNSGIYDLVISSVAVTPDRSKRMHFVPYLNVGVAISVQTGNPKHITTLASLSGHSVAVQSGTIEVDMANAENKVLTKQHKARIDIHSFTSDADAAVAVQTSQIDALFDDYPIVGWRVKQSRGRMVFAGPQFAMDPYGVAVPLKDVALYQDVQKALKAIKANGTYAKILAKYGLSTAAM